MLWFTPLPPLLYEVINCALFAGATSWLIICIRYLVTAYCQLRRIRPGEYAPRLSRSEAFAALHNYRVAIGLMIFLFGESPRMGYLWLVRYLGNTGHDVAWLSQGGWIFVPVLASALSIVGCACSVRAIIPRVWGRYGYCGTLLIVIAAVVATQIFR
jgi:hypothetical protein